MVVRDQMPGWIWVRSAKPSITAADETTSPRSKASASLSLDQPSNSKGERRLGTSIAPGAPGREQGYSFTGIIAGAVRRPNE